MRVSCLLGLLLLISGPAQAHKMRSVLLSLSEQAAPLTVSGEAAVEPATHTLVTLDLKSSLNREGRPAAITTRFEPACPVFAGAGGPLAERIDDAVLRRYQVLCEGGLSGRRLHLHGLDPTTPDAFVQIAYADGSSTRHGLSRSHSSIQLKAAGSTQHSSGPTALWPYFGIGVEHILLGIDHLLFVLGLLLLLQLCGARWQLVLGTITAFTVAHSITLALAVLGGVSLPSAPVEMVIALSILLLATEIYSYPRRQQAGLPLTLTVSKPWLVAFGFGLLHGFGFAGALADIGVPAQAAGWALLLFNLGVEAGQLLFVAALIALSRMLASLQFSGSLVPLARGLALHVVGGVAVFWMLERGLPLLGA